MTLWGYGKILDVDLSNGSISQQDIDPGFARGFVGGMGFSLKILHDEVGPDVDPLGPDNILVFANGPLTGTKAPCGARTEITTKSPLTGSVGTGNTGGMWGTLLKRAGFDVIVVRGNAANPVYLWIDDDKVELREAGHLWGKDTRPTSDILRDQLSPPGEAQASIMAIGPAGENLVRYSCPINDYRHAAARAGAGAVMGAKKLKALAVRGSGDVRIARPDEFREAASKARERTIAAANASRMPGAPPDARLAYFERGCLQAKNYQFGTLPGWLETRSRDVAMKYVARKDGTCFACPISCFFLAEVKEGKYAGVEGSRGAAPGVTLHWGAKCAIDNMPAIWKCKELCEQYGLDYVSASGCVSFAMELFQRGIITSDDTDGLELTWGNDDAAAQLLRKIAFRDGFGGVLAEGSLRAAASIGRGAAQCVLTNKGMEVMSCDPRAGSKGWIFGELTNPRGGDNVKSTHMVGDRYNPNWPFDRLDMFDEVKAKLYSMPPEEVATSWEGKPLMCRWFEDLYSAANALGICFYPVGIRPALGPTHLSRLFSACTGWDTTPEEMMRLGEKVFNLLKAYTARAGLTRKDDTWPDRFFTEPLPDGPAKGAVLSRDTIGLLLDEYYELRGWDKASGLPTRQKLTELGLEDIADRLPA